MVTSLLTEPMLDGATYVKVMTDEQMEDLRRQISVYAAICEQLVEMHKAITARNDSISGMRLGNLYCDPLVTSGGHKIAARQRWIPTPIQLQILDGIFDQGNGTPSKQKIKEIAHDLSQHGQISETNVYNWFQNRRARSKRKQTNALANNTELEAEADGETNALANNTELEAEADGESRCENKDKSLKISSNDNSSPTNSNSSGSHGQMSFYENILSNPRNVAFPLCEACNICPGIDLLMEKMEVPRSYSPFQSGESYDLLG